MRFAPEVRVVPKPPPVRMLTRMEVEKGVHMHDVTINSRQYDPMLLKRGLSQPKGARALYDDFVHVHNELVEKGMFFESGERLPKP